MIQDAVGATYTRLFGAFTISPAPQLGNLTVGQWTVGKSGFTGTLAILRGTGPFSISSISGLPDGMSAALSGRSVVFTGTPTLAQTYAAGSITVADATGTTASQTFTITINPALTLGPLSQTAWIGGKTGYNGTLAIGGGTGPYVITGLAGLAPGLTATISAGAVKFAGMPLQFGKFAGGVTVRDAAGVKVVQTFTITINPPLSAGVLTLNHWAIGVSGYTGTIALHGGCGGNTIVATTGLPPGLTAVVTGQTISFTDVPTATGTYTGSITIQDVIGAVLKVPFTITITAS